MNFPVSRTKLLITLEAEREKALLLFNKDVLNADQTIGELLQLQRLAQGFGFQDLVVKTAHDFHNVRAADADRKAAKGAVSENNG